MISAAAIALAIVLSSSAGLYPSDAQAQPSIQIDPGGSKEMPAAVARRN